VGVATVTITGAGNYTGTKNATFNILMEVNVTFTEGRTWGTYVSENTNLTVPTGLKAYVVTGVNGSSVNVSEIGYIPAGSAVLLEKTGDEVGSTAGLYDGEVSSEITNLLKATTAATAVSSIEGGTVYVLYNNEFRRTTSGTIPANRGFLLIESSTAEIAGASLMIVDDEDVTAISTDKVAAPKAGQAQWYTLDGRKLTGKPAAKGLYIYNGRTVVVK